MRRTNQDLAKQILYALNVAGPMRPTNISFATQANYKRTIQLLELLETTGLVRKHESTFSITDKGKLFLQAAQNPILNLISPGYGQ